MPQMKSNQGSIGSAGLVFLRTWKPKSGPERGASWPIGRNLLNQDMKVEG